MARKRRSYRGDHTVAEFEDFFIPKIASVDKWGQLCTGCFFDDKPFERYRINGECICRVYCKKRTGYIYQPKVPPPTDSRYYRYERVAERKEREARELRKKNGINEAEYQASLARRRRIAAGLPPEEQPVKFIDLNQRYDKD